MANQKVMPRVRNSLQSRSVSRTRQHRERETASKIAIVVTGYGRSGAMVPFNWRNSVPAQARTVTYPVGAVQCTALSPAIARADRRPCATALEALRAACAALRRQDTDIAVVCDDAEEETAVLVLRRAGDVRRDAAIARVAVNDAPTPSGPVGLVADARQGEGRGRSVSWRENKSFCLMFEAADDVATLVVLIEALDRRTLPATLSGRFGNPTSGFVSCLHSLPWPGNHGETPAASMVTYRGCALFARAEAGVRSVEPPAALVLLSAADASRARRSLTKLHRACSRGAGLGEVAALAASLSDGGPARIAVVADTAVELFGQLERLAAGGYPRDAAILDGHQGAYLNMVGADPGRLAVLFPGHGAQYHGMLREQATHLPQVRSWFESLDAHGGEGVIACPFRHVPLDAAEPRRESLEASLNALEGGGVCASVGALGLYDTLRTVGVMPDVFCGYSNGENVALIAAGILDLRRREQLFRLIGTIAEAGRGGLERGEIPFGTSLAVTTLNRPALDAFLAARGGEIEMVADNAPSQVTLHGSSQAIEAAAEQLAERGTLLTVLPFQRSYHTARFAPEMPSVVRALAHLPIGRGRVPVLSCASVDYFPTRPGAIRALAASQYVSTIRFREAVERLYSENVRIFVEAGPRGRLASYVRKILMHRDFVAVELDRPDRPGLRQVLNALARIFVAGVDINGQGLFADHKQ